jgi:hypothetical protein
MFLEEFYITLVSKYNDNHGINILQNLAPFSPKKYPPPLYIILIYLYNFEIIYTYKLKQVIYMISPYI